MSNPQRQPLPLISNLHSGLKPAKNHLRIHYECYLLAKNIREASLTDQVEIINKILLCAEDYDMPEVPKYGKYIGVIWREVSEATYFKIKKILFAKGIHPETFGEEITTPITTKEEIKQIKSPPPPRISKAAKELLLEKEGKEFLESLKFQQSTNTPKSVQDIFKIFDKTEPDEES